MGESQMQCLASITKQTETLETNGKEKRTGHFEVT